MEWDGMGWDGMGWCRGDGIEAMKSGVEFGLDWLAEMRRGELR